MYVANSQVLLIDRLIFTASGPPNRREAERHPSFQPITIVAGGIESDLRAFSREISRTRIGLLHESPLPQGAGYAEYQ